VARVRDDRTDEYRVRLGLLPLLIVVGGNLLFGFALIHSVLMGREELAATFGGIFLLFEIAALSVAAMCSSRRGSLRASAVVHRVGEITLESAENAEPARATTRVRASAAQASDLCSRCSTGIPRRVGTPTDGDSSLAAPDVENVRSGR